MDHKSQKIIFFDGVCSLCNGFIDFLIRFDPKKELFFSPLQGETAKELIGQESLELSSIIFLAKGVKYAQSEAALRTMASLGGFWRFALLFLAIPSPIRDWVYRQIANNRYKLFGKRNTCRVPTEEERERFLP